MQVEYLYEQGTPFTGVRAYGTPGSSTRASSQADLAYAYGMRNVHIKRRVSSLDGRASETRYDTRDHYGNPTAITEIFRGGGEPEISRTVNRTYDNGVRDGKPGWGTHRWTVGLLTQELVQSDEAQPYKKHWRYDRHGRLVETNENMSRRVFDYGGDGVENPTSDPISVTDGLGRRTRFTQYKHGIATTTIQPNGGMPTKILDDLGNVVSERDANGVSVARGFGQTFGRLGREVPGGGRAGTTYTAALWHDGAPGDRRRIDTVEVDGLLRSHVHHDALGRVVWTRTNPIGGNGPKQHQRLQRNLVGRVIRASDVAESVPSDIFSDSFEGMVYTYDSLGRVLSERHSSETGDNPGIRYCYGRSCDGHPDVGLAGAAPYVKYGFAMADQYNNWTVRNFRAIGDLANAELVEIVQWVGTNERSDPRAAPIVRTLIDRNLVGFVKRVEQVGVGGSFARVRRDYTPYAFGETTTSLLGSETWLDFGGQSMTRAVTNRDAEGRPVRERRFDGSEFMRTYDTMGWVTNVASIGEPPSGGRRSAALGYGYYQNGALKSASTDGGRTTWEYTYESGSGDPTGEKLTVDPGDGGSNLVFEIGYVPGPLGAPTEMTYPSGRTLALERNAYGQVTALPGYVESAGYAASGAMTDYRLANGTSFAMTEDARRRPGTWDVTTATTGEKAILGLHYHYNRKGQVERIDDYFPGREASLIGVRYDGLGRLWEVKGPWTITDTEDTAWYAYSDTGDITFRGIGGQDMQYEYAGERLTATKSVNWAAMNHPVADDGNGNVTQALGATHNFDQDNRLKSTFRDGVIQHNLYDAHGRRVRVSSNSMASSTGMWNRAAFDREVFFVYDQAGTLVHEHDRETGERRDHVRLAGRTIATVEKHDDHDSDQDGIPDWYEHRHGLLANDASDAASDADGDGLSNLAEYERGSWSSRRDTDGDQTEDSLDSDYGGFANSGSDPDEPVDDDPDGGTGGTDPAGPGSIPASWIPLD